jgi:putative thiamine transport system permease protein
MAGGVRLARLAPPLTLAILLGPLAFGLAGTALPALGYLPELGGERFTTAHFCPWRSAGHHAFGGSFDLDRTGDHAGFARRGGGVCRQRSRDTATFARMRRMISPLAVGTACGGGLRSRLPDCAIGHADAADLAMGSQGSTGPPDLLIVNDPMALSMMAGLIVKEIPFLFLVTLAALPQTRHVETMRLGRSLGYGRIASFHHPAVAAALPADPARGVRSRRLCQSVVDVALILGPHLPPTLPVRLIDWMNDPDLETRFLASAGAVMQLGVTLTALVAWIVLERIGALLVCSSARQAGAGAGT